MRWSEWRIKTLADSSTIEYRMAEPDYDEPVDPEPSFNDQMAEGVLGFWKFLGTCFFIGLLWWVKFFELLPENLERAHAKKK
jgi:hypothetical protein